MKLLARYRLHRHPLWRHRTRRIHARRSRRRHHTVNRIRPRLKMMKT